MFYLSLIFILAGIFIFLYSLFKGFSDRLKPNLDNPGPRKNRASVFLKKVKRPDDRRRSERVYPVKEKDPIHDEDDVMGPVFVEEAPISVTDKIEESEYYESPIELQVDEHEEPRVAKAVNIDEHEEPRVAEAVSVDAVKSEVVANDDDVTFAVLFDDSSNAFDHYKESGSILPDLEKYNEIKRVGKGKFSIEKDGISFYIDKKLFRFDFQRIEGLNRGNNYIALSLHGSDSVKIFVFLNKTEIIEMVALKYGEFKG
ncbi:hypothetical protein ACFL20_00640 [Spirochaetota bacterium]